MAQVRPTEDSVTKAAASIIDAAGLITKVVPRWVLGLELGEVVTYLAPKDGDSLLPVNSWILTVTAWVPTTVKSASGRSVVPKNFTPGFDDWQTQPADQALQVDYKISVTGTLKIWQLVEYRQGDDDDNSELDSAVQRQTVIDEISKQPRLGLEWGDFEHDQIKFPSILQIPFNNSLLHLAQGNLPFTFSYVAPAA